MTDDQLMRCREQLGYFWRAIAPFSALNITHTVATSAVDPFVCARSAVVLLFLARFSYGNYNYTASTFTPTATWFNGANAAREIRKRFVWDAVLFALQLAALTSMALAVNHPSMFFIAVELFLLVDVLFLVFDRHSWPTWTQWVRQLWETKPGPATDRIELTRIWPVFYPPRVWVSNNFLTAATLVAAEVLLAHLGSATPENITIAFAFGCVVNSMVDLHCALRHM